MTSKFEGSTRSNVRAPNPLLCANPGMPPSSADQTLETTHHLLEKAQGGDDAALDVLYRRHLSRLRRWARGRLPGNARDLMDTEDVVQQALTRALSNLKAFEPEHQGAFQAYLRTSVLNLIRDQVRRRNRRPRVLESAGQVIAAEPSPLQLALSQEKLERYDRAIDRLRPGEREALVSRLELGMSYQEIARETGGTSDAVRMAVKRAVVKLARFMAEDERAGY